MGSKFKFPILHPHLPIITLKLNQPIYPLIFTNPQKRKTLKIEKIIFSSQREIQINKQVLNYLKFKLVKENETCK